MAEPGHRPHRKGHRILERLAVSPAPLAELRRACGVSGAASKKLWRLAGSMVEHGLIESLHGVYEITYQGRCALEQLRAGESVIVGEAQPAPNVRIFARAA